MKGKIKNTIVVLLLLLFSFRINAQELFVNQGEVYVSSKTEMSIYFDFLNTHDGVFINDGDVHIHKNFTNNGLVFFTNGEEGKTRFIGNEIQKITGDMQSDFYDVLFENTSIQPAFHLSSEISISGEGEFSEGIVDNEDYGGLVIFNQNATHNLVSDNSHVDGLVQKLGDESFQFPVGDTNKFRFAEISAPDLLEDQITTQYLFENSNELHPHENKAGIIELIDANEYWTIERTHGDSEVVVTLSWDEDTTPNAITVAPQSAIHIVRWDENRQLWVDEGGIVDSANKTVSTSFSVSDFGVFTLARVEEGIVLGVGTGVVTVYNGVTPNDDGVNDVFLIDGLENFPENTLEIYNGWGILVYEVEGYAQDGKLFKGYSEGRVTIDKNNKLPTGTYYYILKFKDLIGNSTEKAGYLYIQQ